MGTAMKNQRLPGAKSQRNWRRFILILLLSAGLNAVFSSTALSQTNSPVENTEIIKVKFVNATTNRDIDSVNIDENEDIIIKVKDLDSVSLNYPTGSQLMIAVPYNKFGNIIGSRLNATWTDFLYV